MSTDWRETQARPRGSEREEPGRGRVREGPWVVGQEYPLENEMATRVFSVFLPGEFHGQRNLVGFSPWGHSQT